MGPSRQPLWAQKSKQTAAGCFFMAPSNHQCAHGQAEPSDHEPLTYEDANLQLRLGLKNPSDRSMLARTLCNGLASPKERFEHDRQITTTDSLFSFITAKGTDGVLGNTTGLYDAQASALQSVLSDKHPVARVSGPPGTGKTFLIGEICWRFQRAAKEWARSMEGGYLSWWLTRGMTELSQARRGANAEGNDPSASVVTQAFLLHYLGVKDPQALEKLEPLAVVMTRTNGAARDLAHALSRAKCEFVLVKSSRCEQFNKGTFYRGLEQHCVNSGDFNTIPRTLKTLKGMSVVVCTEGNFAAIHHNLVKLGKPQMVVVDEASRIPSTSLATTLQQIPYLPKLAVFGDTKQLSPYHLNETHDLHSAMSALEMTAAKDAPGFGSLIKTFFLDRSYRLPSKLAHRLSSIHYDHLLKDSKGILPDVAIEAEGSLGTRDEGHDYYLRYVSVGRSTESRKSGDSSLTNKAEAMAAVDIALLFEKHGVSWSILTFYAAQRSFIANELAKRMGFSGQESAGALDISGERVFTVDSFQGKEDDAIILSPTRCRVEGTRRGGQGNFASQRGTERPVFVLDEERQTVAMSRSKRFLVVLTSQMFMEEARSFSRGIMVDLALLSNWAFYPEGFSTLDKWIAKEQTRFLNAAAQPADLGPAT